MKWQNIFFGILFTIGMIFPAQSQTDPGWQWAKRGGGISTVKGYQIYDTGMERVVDIAVDSDNNYYFLAEVGDLEFTYDGMEFETYNSLMGATSKDIFLFSTDQEGNFRWKKIIGGGGNDHATSLGLDNADNVYVSGTVYNSSLSYYPPPHFDTDTIKDPVSQTEESDMNRDVFLIKYDQEGNYQWLVEPQGGERTWGTGGMQKTVVEEDGTTHSLLALWARPGYGDQTYFDEALTIEEGDYANVIVIYDSGGNFQSFFEVDMEPGNSKYKYQLAYDPSLERYYIADTKRKHAQIIGIGGYGAEDDEVAFYLAAVNHEGEVLWYHANHWGDKFATGDLQLDSDGNIYFSGKFSNASNEDDFVDSFAGYEFTMPDNPSVGYESAFIVKLDSDGDLLWGANGQWYSPFPGQGIAIAGDDVYLGMGTLQNNWGGLEVPGPHLMGLNPNIMILRFNAQTGEALEAIPNSEITSTQDAIMPLRLDRNGDLIAGGYFGATLFPGTDFEIENIGNDSDFFIAKYATGTETNPCAPPTDLTVDEIGAESVLVTWTPGGEETQWKVAYGSAGFDPETEGNTLTVNTSEATLEDLDPETDYIVYVRAMCGEDSHSSWAGSVSFTTGVLSVEDQQIEGLKIHPNPTGGILHIKSQTPIKTYILYDLRGRMIEKSSLKTGRIDLSGLENGLYILGIQDRNGNKQNVKVVKK